MEAPLLEAYRLWKRYEEVVALRECSFTLLPGRIVGLLGPNGSGKSTLLRILAGVLQPDAGHLRFPGLLHPRAQIGYLPEEQGLYRHHRVREQLLYIAALRGLRGRAARHAVHEWLERLGAAAYATRRTEELSKGMLQKVQLAATLLHRPSLLLLDEPTSSLDPMAVHELTALLRELRQQGCTTVLSTHQLEHAEHICDDVLLIQQGHIVLAASLHELKARYRRRTLTVEFHGDITPVVARFPTAHILRQSAHRLELLWPNAELTDLQEFLQHARQHVAIRSLVWNEASLREIVLELLQAGPPPEPR